VQRSVPLTPRGNVTEHIMPDLQGVRLSRALFPWALGLLKSHR
jgi:hypothetical protein